MQQDNDVGYTEQYRPMSAWGYIGYGLLFAIPIVGFILLIVYSFDNSYINRRNYARSYWCALILGAIVALVLYKLIFSGSVPDISHWTPFAAM